jgi:hypothetical protein
LRLQRKLRPKTTVANANAAHVTATAVTVVNVANAHRVKKVKRLKARPLRRSKLLASSHSSKTQHVHPSQRPRQQQPPQL